MAIGDKSTLVILESPYAGAVEGNVRYARAAVRDSLLRGEAPMASHLLYTQQGILNDDVPSEREHGINAGLSWGSVADKTVIYIDRGISRGMEYGIKKAISEGRPLDFRSLKEYATADGLTVRECKEKYLSIKIPSDNC